MVKNLIFFSPNVVFKRFGTLTATQKTAALYKAPFLIKKNCQKLAVFNKKKAFLTIFRLQPLRTYDSYRASSPRQTESYSVQPHLPLAATINPAGRSRVFSDRVWPAV